MPGSGTPSGSASGPSRRARGPVPPPDDQNEITSTYRANYGGPAGASASSWTSRSTADGGSSVPTTPASVRGPPSRQTSNLFAADSPSITQDSSGAVAARRTASGIDEPSPAAAAAATPSASFSSATRADGGGGAALAALDDQMRRLDVLDGADSAAAAAAVAVAVSPRSEGMLRAQAAIDAARKQLQAGGGVVPGSPGTAAAAGAAGIAGSAGASPRTDAPPPGAATSPAASVGSVGGGASPSAAAAAVPPSAETADAAHRAAALVSALTTGSPSQQRAAAETLRDDLRVHGEPVRVAAHQAGGTHMLQTLVRSGAPELRQPCAAALAELCSHPPALAEVAAAPDAPRALIGWCLEGIPAGDAPATALFCAVVTAEESPGVREACAGHKAVRRLADTLSAPAAPREAKLAALTALEALCVADPGPNLRKLAWSGGLPALVPALHPPVGAAAEAAMGLLLLALGQDRRHAEALATPGLIEALSELVADPDVGAPMQTGAARVLAAIATLRSRKDDATRALTDCALPRACEVLRRAEQGGDGGELEAACALLVGHLSLGSPLACHVVLFHAQALHTLVDVLSGAREYSLVEAVLGATAAYAAAPTALM